MPLHWYRAEQPLEQGRMGELVHVRPIGGYEQVMAEATARLEQLEPLHSRILPLLDVQHGFLDEFDMFHLVKTVPLFAAVFAAGEHFARQQARESAARGPDAGDWP